MVNQNQYIPDYVIHPGEYIEEILEVREMKKQDFAKRCGLSVKTVSQILNQKVLFSSDIAMHFERVLGISAELIMNMITNYQMYESRLKDKAELENKVNWFKQFPQRELVKKNIIPDSNNNYEKANSLLDFFNVSEPDTWDVYYKKKAIFFRKPPAFISSLASTATWLRIGEKSAENIECSSFDKEIFRENLKKIRKYTTKKPGSFEQGMKKMCSDAGVALVFVPELKQIHISGAAEWLAPDKALIIMSLRYKTNDYFWFTFFHEAGHILLHNKKDVFIDTKDVEYSEVEIEANNFAKRILINQVKYKNFLKKNKIFKTDVLEFSRENDIAPGIIVGMLQHDKKIEYSWFNDLKERYETT